MKGFVLVSIWPLLVYGSDNGIESRTFNSCGGSWLNATFGELKFDSGNIDELKEDASNRSFSRVCTYEIVAKDISNGGGRPKLLFYFTSYGIHFQGFCPPTTTFVDTNGNGVSGLPSAMCYYNPNITQKVFSTSGSRLTIRYGWVGYLPAGFLHTAAFSIKFNTFFKGSCYEDNIYEECLNEKCVLRGTVCSSYINGCGYVRNECFQTITSTTSTTPNTNTNTSNKYYWVPYVVPVILVLAIVCWCGPILRKKLKCKCAERERSDNSPVHVPRSSWFRNSPHDRDNDGLSSRHMEDGDNYFPVPLRARELLENSYRNYSYDRDKANGIEPPAYNEPESPPSYFEVMSATDKYQVT